MKSLYNEFLSLTEEGRALQNEAHSAIRLLIDNWTAKGYSPREIGDFIAASIPVCYCYKIMEMRAKGLLSPKPRTKKPRHPRRSSQ